jgi:hypothetical protein
MRNSGLRIQRTDDRLIVQSKPMTIFTRLSGAVLCGVFLFWAIVLIEFGGRSEFAQLIWLILLVGLFLLIVSIQFPRSVDTIFDLQSRRVIRRTNILGRLDCADSYAFAEILGVGVVRGSGIDERDPMPVILLKDGTVLPFGVFNLNRFYVDDAACAKVLDDISMATGLQQYNNLR